MRLKQRVGVEQQRGVSALSYGLLVGLVGVVALVAVTSSGSNINQLFLTSSDALIGITPSGSGGSGSGNPSSSPAGNSISFVTGNGDIGPFTEDTSPGQVQLQVSDGGSSPSFAVTGGSLPPGMSLSSGGELSSSGIPAVSGDAAQSYSFTVTATNTDNGQTAQQSFDVTVCPVMVFSTPVTASSLQVPVGCGSAQVHIWGAGGGGSGDGASVIGYTGGPGGYTSASLSFSEGANLFVVVGSGGSGGPPGQSNVVVPRSTHGEGGAGISWGGGGGGYSGLFTSSSLSQGTAIAIAGGGGGGGVKCNSVPTETFEGSAGGGTAGVTIGNSPETANSGTQSTGGSPGTFDNSLFGDAESGTALRGGDGFVTTSGSNWGGGGGGGFYGGGGGGVFSCRVGGGGGGSGYINSSFGSGSLMSISLPVNPPGTSEARYISGVGVSGVNTDSSSANQSGSDGGNGLVVIEFGQ
ncbi:MAG: hypothetical protein Alpg2KO_18050 [Alphaproteobacteria bacterium]